MTRFGARRFRPKPSWLVLGSLATTGLLWLSNWLCWPPWHKGYAVLSAVAGVGAAMLLMFAWFAVAVVFRWRFQFSIRSLLLLVVVVALPCSWLGVEIKKAREQQKAVIALCEAGEVFDNCYGSPQFTDGNIVGLKPHDNSGLKGSLLLDVDFPGPIWVLDLLERDFFYDTENVYIGAAYRVDRLGRKFEPFDTLDSDASFESLHYFFNGPIVSDTLPASGDPCDDNLLAKLEYLPRIHCLFVSGPKITDAGLSHIAALTELRSLSLSHTAVTDSGLEQLHGLKKPFRPLPICDESHRRRRRQAPEGPAPLQNHPLICPPPVLGADRW